MTTALQLAAEVDVAVPPALAADAQFARGQVVRNLRPITVARGVDLAT